MTDLNPSVLKAPATKLPFGVSVLLRFIGVVGGLVVLSIGFKLLGLTIKWWLR